MPTPTPRLSHCHARTQSRPHISPLPSLYYAHTRSHSRTHAKDRLRTLKHVVFKSYDELNKYLAAVESPLQMPVLASSAFLETQAVISSLPPSLHNFSKNTPLSLPIPPLPSKFHDHIAELIDMPRPSPSTRSSPSTPSTRGVPPRSGSFDDPAYLVARPQPFSKRPRNDHTDYDFRPLPP
jgi:hypothetical protein